MQATDVWLERSRRRPVAAHPSGLAFSTLQRLNKMIELLAAGQPVYDVGVTGVA
jgi:hypothetical protein